MIAKVSKVLLLIITLLFPLWLNAQTVTTPYFCSFETDAECAAWTSRTAARVNTSFVIGSAIKSTGAKSLYTSCTQGATAGYDITGAGYCSTAYISISLDAGYHDLVFDYKILTDADFDDIRLMISLVPTSTNILPFATAIGGDNFNKNATAGQIFLSNPNQEYKRSGWRMTKVSFDVPTAGDYYLVFLFKQKAISEKVRYGSKYPNRTGVNIDNISIDKSTTYGSCYEMPTGITATREPAGMRISWRQIPGATYDLMYYRINRPASDTIVPDTVFNITTTDYLMPYATIPYGAYKVRVRSKCASGTSTWGDKQSITLFHGPSDYCFDYWNLDDPEAKCTAGQFGRPFDRVMTLDYGYESRESYHTVHFDTAEYDPVTDYQLRTVLDGHWASVRLGQGAESGPYDGISQGGPGERMSAALTFGYRVPMDADLFLLNYAPVLQFAAHHPEREQTQIVIDILDEYGAMLDSRCLRSKFNSISLKKDEVAGVADPGWHNFRPDYGQFGAAGPTSPDEIKWHDWMIMGFNLKPYAGQKVQFRISLDPCGASYHFAYIYLVPMCASSSVQGMSCSETASTFEVPEGFNYRWYKQNDRNKTVICRDRTFSPDPTDPDSYYVDLVNKEDSTCYFTLEAYVLPRLPQPRLTWTATVENCQTVVKFDATATRIVEVRDTGLLELDPAKAKPTSYTWSLGALGTLSGDMPKLVFPNEGGTFPVTLSCDYNGCIVDTTFDVVVEPFGSAPAQLTKTICQGDVYTVNKKDYTEEGYYADTIVGGSFFGCDSIINISLHVIPHTTVDTVVSVTSEQLPYAMEIDGKKYTFVGPRDTTIVISSREMRKCDSIDYNVHLEVVGVLEVAIDALPMICADDDEFTLTYQVTDGYCGSVAVNFDAAALAVGFSNNAVAYDDSKITITMPEGNLRPDSYHVDLIFENEYSERIIPVDFMVLYSSTVIAQRWNDVLAIKNSDYNGGYNFVAFQWFKDNTPLVGAIASQLYTEGENLTFGAEYSVLLTRIDDSKSIMTCPFLPVEYNEGENGYHSDIVVTFDGTKAEVSVPQNAMAYFYNSTGGLISSYNFTAGTVNTFALPTTKGVYLLRLVYHNGTTRTLKILI